MSQIMIIDGEIQLDGQPLPPLPHKQLDGSIDIAQINERVFVNGYEWFDGQWRLTLRSVVRYIISTITG